MPKKVSKNSARKGGKSKRSVSEMYAAIEKARGILGDTSDMIRQLRQDHEEEDKLLDRKYRDFKLRY